MAIATDNYVAYDLDGHYYYLTEAGMIKYTGYENLINIWKNAPQRLKSHGRNLHLKYTKSRYNNKRIRFKHKDIVEYKINLNENGERQAIIDSLTAIIEASYDNDWDRDLYSGKVEWPEAILDPLHEAKILVYGEFVGSVPEDVYRVNY